MGDAAVVFEGVSYAYPGSLGEAPVEALRDVSLTIERGQRLGILGPNGGGKTTLIRLLLGELTPTSGRVRVFGGDPAQGACVGRVGFVPQRMEIERRFPISVERFVGLALTCRSAPWRSLDAAGRDRVRDSLEMVGAEGLAARPIAALSGGQLQRVMIARSIAPRPDLLVLDEPTLGVDVAGQRLFSGMIASLQSALGITVVIVTHELRTIAASADRVACLSRTLHFHDAPSGLTPSVLAQVFAHDVEGVFGEIHVDAHAAEDCDNPAHGHDHAGVNKAGEKNSGHGGCGGHA
jgi:zinc transport system ATP-binding protein